MQVLQQLNMLVYSLTFSADEVMCSMSRNVQFHAQYARKAFFRALPDPLVG